MATQSSAGIAEGKKNRLEQAIEGLAEGVGNAIGFLAGSGILFGIFALLWVAFAAALLVSPASFEAAWEWIGSLPLVVQGLLWLLFLPVLAGMWIWETDWPLIVRLVLVVAIAGWSLLVMLPRAANRG
jgi:hypothetical protein